MLGIKLERRKLTAGLGRYHLPPSAAKSSWKSTEIIFISWNWSSSVFPPHLPIEKPFDRWWCKALWDCHLDSCQELIDGLVAQVMLLLESSDKALPKKYLNLLRPLVAACPP